MLCKLVFLEEVRTPLFAIATGSTFIQNGSTEAAKVKYVPVFHTILEIANIRAAFDITLRYVFPAAVIVSRVFSVLPTANAYRCTVNIEDERRNMTQVVI
jgi:hypothetical protein